MRKILTIGVSILSALSLCACNSTTIETTAPVTEQVTEQVIEQATEPFEPYYMTEDELISTIRHIYDHKPIEGEIYNDYTRYLSTALNIPYECFTNTAEYSGTSIVIGGVGQYNEHMDSSKNGTMRNTNHCYLYICEYFYTADSAISAYNRIYWYVTIDRGIHTTNYNVSDSTFWYTGLFEYKEVLESNDESMLSQEYSLSYATLTKLGESKYLLTANIPLYEVENK